MKSVFIVLVPLLMVACGKEIKKAPKVTLDPEATVTLASGEVSDLSVGQWNTNKVGMSQVWDKFTTNKAMRIMLISSGVDYRHPDLTDNIEKKMGSEQIGVGYDVIDHDNMAFDHHGIGTKIAGIIVASHDGKGINGLLKNASLIPVRYLNENGATNYQLLLEALDVAIQEKPSIIQIVLPQSLETRSQVTNEAMAMSAREKIKKLAELEIPVVIAAGNGMSDVAQLPLISKVFKSQKNVIIVTSVNEAGNKSSLANFSSNQVTTSAPGENILTTVKDGGYETVSGTDYAAAHVTAAIAFALANFRGQMSLEDIHQALMSDEGSDANINMTAYTLGRNQLNISKYLNHLDQK